MGDAFPDDVERFVSTYRPRFGGRPEQQVDTSTLREVAQRTCSSIPVAKKLCPALASYIAWVRSEGIDPMLDTLADADLVERYIQTGMPDAAESSRATRRSLLRTMARRVGAPKDAPPLPEPLAYRRVKPPYNASEIRRYLRLAEDQPTAGRRDSMSAVLNLGLGCGLDGRDMAWVTGRDVTNTDDGAVRVRVTGGSRPREVIALDDQGIAITGLAIKAGSNLLIGGSTLGRHNVTSAALNRALVDKSLPRLVASRLRSTWLVDHLRRGTPLSVLLPAAGLTTARPLEDLLEFVTPLPAEQVVRLLRGPG